MVCPMLAEKAPRVEACFARNALICPSITILGD
jgi:hypothetical protein